MAGTEAGAANPHLTPGAESRRTKSSNTPPATGVATSNTLAPRTIRVIGRRNIAKRRQDVPRRQACRRNGAVGAAGCREGRVCQTALLSSGARKESATQCDQQRAIPAPAVWIEPQDGVKRNVGSVRPKALEGRTRLYPSCSSWISDRCAPVRSWMKENRPTVSTSRGGLMTLPPDSSTSRSASSRSPTAK